jgi:two-component system, sensor histidine kinase and response regulator
MLPTVVCIDDEAHNNEALERLLRKKYQIFTATTPQEGLDLIKKYQPALIISDQRMPQMTGVELLKKSLSDSPESMRILLTGYTDLESVISAINEGQIYRYLTKPWEPNDVLMTIESALDSYNMKQEIKKQNEELKGLDKLKTDFMILVTHELRTPLAGISSFVELLKEELKSDDHKMYLSHIEKNTFRLKKLVEDILLITRLKKEKKKIEPTEVDFHKFVKNCWNGAKEKNKSLNLDIAGKDVTISTQEDSFKEIFNRLFSNCFQHAPDGVAVRVHAADREDDVQFTVSNPCTEDLVLSPQTLLSAFTKNEKIMNHTQGTGLGLAIVHALAESLKGSLQISAKNKVFTATVNIPKNPTP